MKSDPAQRGNEKVESESTPAPAAKKSRPKPIVIVGVVLVVLIGAVFGIRAYAYSSTHETTDDAQIDGNLVTITSKITERIASIDVATNTYVRKGQVLIHLDSSDERRRYEQAEAALAASRAQVRAATANLELTRDQQEAQVAQGESGVAQAAAGVAGAREQVSQARDQISVAQADVVTAQAQVRAAEAAAKGAEATYRRASSDLARSVALTRTGDAPASELDAARSTAANAFASKEQADANISVARANLDAAQKKLASQRSALAASQSNVAAQNSLVASARGKRDEVASPYRISTQRSSILVSDAQSQTQAAALAQARDQLEYTVIRSPIDGYVGERSVEVGQTVSPGATLMTVIPPSTGLFITANYKETQIGKIRPGMRVEISIDAYPGREFRGKVAAMPPASQATYSLIPAQNSTGNFVKVTQRLPVRIYVDEGVDQTHPLRVGMSVVTSVETK